MVIDRNKSEKIATRFPGKIFSQIEKYAEEMQISKSEAIRNLVEDRLDELSHRSKDRASFERLTRVIEYLFASTQVQNLERLSDEGRTQLMTDMWKNHRKYHYKFDDRD